MYILSFLSNIITSFLVLYNIFYFHKRQDKKRTLCFFMLISLILSTEKTLSWVFHYVPFFSGLKLLAVIYLGSPGLNNPLIVYKHYMKPFMAKNELLFDRLMNLGHEYISKAFLVTKKKFENKNKKNFANKIEGKVEELKEKTEETQPIKNFGELKQETENFSKQIEDKTKEVNFEEKNSEESSNL